MEIKKEKAILRLLNKNCLNPEIPAYNHIFLHNQRYTLVNPPKAEDKFSENTYLEYNVVISGKILRQKGFMPNPMVEIPTIEILEILFL